tara:strand:- start:3013 stop:3489 length:477 start_codon:yes stop_codon:yes gene_type:complete
MEIAFCPNYEIYKDGTVMNKKRGTPVKPSNQSAGYIKVCLMDLNSRKTYPLLHRLLAIAYIDNPDNLPMVDHKNRNKKDNRLENLHWVSRRDNCLNIKKTITVNSITNEKYIRYRGGRYIVNIHNGVDKYYKSWHTLEQAVCDKVIYIKMNNLKLHYF